YISSAGLRLLVALQKQVKADGKQLTLRNPNKVVKEVFSVAGFNKAFNIV
ncbi:MAG: STAS domain-containing protein, partial [Clostridia bacterium]|nr:STAS domain-containing protein [Clostridia bacterium]